MLTSPLAWQPLIDERRTVGEVIKSWSVNPQTRRGAVTERPRWGRWSYAAWRAQEAWEREVASPLRGLRAIMKARA